ncbi:AlpA family phage regulatory protein [Aeromonas hydrophila]|nr:AlpA family phage regulatory protein [Aeromonas hydrophila]
MFNFAGIRIPIRIGPRSVSWILSEIEEWIESKKSLR